MHSTVFGFSQPQRLLHAVQRRRRRLRQVLRRRHPRCLAEPAPLAARTPRSSHPPALGTAHRHLFCRRTTPRPFCPLEVLRLQRHGSSPPQATMTVARYGSLDGREPRFDRHLARVHLTRHLGFSEEPLTALPTAVQTAFAQWPSASPDTITVHPRGPIILMPPAWFR